MSSFGSILASRSLDRRRLILSAAALGMAASVPRLAGAQDATPGADAGADWKLDLNSATDDELLTVPDTGDRMLHEFLEYRPYTSIQQFRQEIGKYVDDSQVAAYEQHVFVPVDPNAADLETMKQLPGVDDAIAQQLLDGAPYDNGFAFLTKLAELVPGVDLAQAQAYVPSAAKLNLNDATSDQLMTVPGGGERMTREFGEYKPYTSILQFRKEIGKYVDDAQVAAYETYLYVPVDPNAADVDTLQQLPGVDATSAQALIDGRPYDTNDTFAAALAERVPTGKAAAARRYLTGA